MVRKILGRAMTRKRSVPTRFTIEHERLTSLINSMADGVLALDTHLRVILSNGAALNILDVNSSLRGRALADIFQPIDAHDQKIDIAGQIRATKTPTFSNDLRLRYADGSTINLYMSIAPVHLGFRGRGQHGFVLLLRDITHEKSLEEERNDFISVVTHELRTPLAIAEGSVSNAQFIVQKNPQDTAAVSQALAEAHSQIMFLSGLVNDLSTLSRAERGKLTLDITPINVSALLQELAQNYSKEAQKRGLEFKTHVPPSLPPLRSGELYVREILQNFLTNALKYTAKGSITLGAEPQQNGVRLYVQDTGIGINKHDQQKVFDKFFRSADPHTSMASGTGLGLYVTLKLARLLRAELKLESQLGHGSVFSIFIPNLR